MLCAVAAWWTKASAAPARVVVWTDSRRGGAIDVSVNGERLGALEEMFSAGHPPCSRGRAALFTELPEGTLQILAVDADGRRWQAALLADAGECLRIRLVDGGRSSVLR